MSPEDFQRFRTRTPFEPFRVYRTDGRVFPAMHPDLLMVGKRPSIIGIVETPAPGLSTYDRFEIVSLLHVVSLEPLPAQPAPGSNGS